MIEFLNERMSPTELVVARRRLGLSAATVDSCIAEHATATMADKAVAITSPDGRVATATFRFVMSSSQAAGPISAPAISA